MECEEIGENRQTHYLIDTFVVAPPALLLSVFPRMPSRLGNTFNLFHRQYWLFMIYLKLAFVNVFNLRELKCAVDNRR